MKETLNALIQLASRENGQALAEYALILTFVFAACVIAVTALGLAIAGGFGGIMGAF
jgi:Flp pilus assembly pilin Flp